MPESSLLICCKSVINFGDSLVADFKMEETGNLGIVFEAALRSMEEESIGKNKSLAGGGGEKAELFGSPVELDEMVNFISAISSFSSLESFHFPQYRRHFPILEQGLLLAPSKHHCQLGFLSGLRSRCRHRHLEW